MSAAVAVLSAGVGACELQEVTVVEVTNLAIAEAYVVLGATPADHSARVYLHGAGASASAGARTYDDATVTVTRDDGLVIGFAVEPLDACVGDLPEGAVGSCFVGDPGSVSGLAAGDALRLDVALGGGGALSGATTVPGDFGLTGVGSSCRLPPDSQLDLRWTRSEGTWAYVNETSINGLPDALALEGIDMQEDPLYLLGLSISAADTTVVFPSEFGIFDRFDLDRDVAVRLQRGLPDGTTAAISITAADRNFTNWARGGNFNPSGAVRLSSVTGDGAGVFGATVVRELVVVSSSTAGAAPPCPTV